MTSQIFQKSHLFVDVFRKMLHKLVLPFNFLYYTAPLSKESRWLGKIFPALPFTFRTNKKHSFFQGQSTSIENAKNKPMSRYHDFNLSPDIVPTNYPTPFPTAAKSSKLDEYFEASTDLSPEQDVALILLQIFSATLSLIGSSIIVFKIVRSLYRSKSSTPYDRIILGLSSCDILASFTYILAPFLLPRATSKRVWAFGNETTCSWLGFLTQLACYWAIWYNCILSFYYLLTVRFQVKRKAFVQKYEMWMHLSGAIFFPLTAAIGLMGNWYSEMRYTMMCWIGEVPKGCDGCWGLVVAYIFGAPSSIITLLAVIINNIVIIVFVRRTLLSSKRTTVATSSEFERTDVESSSLPRPSLSRQRLAHQKRLKKEAAIQGILYVTTFAMTFLPMFVIQIMEGIVGYGDENLQKVYPLLVLNSILLPLQGFFNVFIYVRPNYNRFRAKKPDDSMIMILKLAIFDANIPRISSAPFSGGVNGPNQAANKSPASFEKHDASDQDASNFLNES